MEFSSGLFQVSIWVLPVLLAITLHEAAHGYVAWKLGDDTAYRLGRVSFNPLRHIDPFGTVIMPALLLLFKSPFLFGYAKPVPVKFAALPHPRRDVFLVAFAGPASNFILATLSVLLLKFYFLFPSVMQEWLAYNCINSLRINIVLALFNLLPIPPLDGGRIAVAILPKNLAEPLSRIEPFGIFVVLGVLIFFPQLFEILIYKPLIAIAGFLLTIFNVASPALG